MYGFGGQTSTFHSDHQHSLTRRVAYIDTMRFTLSLLRSHPASFASHFRPTFPARRSPSRFLPIFRVTVLPRPSKCRLDSMTSLSSKTSTFSTSAFKPASSVELPPTQTSPLNIKASQTTRSDANPAPYRLLKQSDFTDWNGQILPRKVAYYLGVGCTVRVCARATENGEDKAGAEAIYVDIVDIIDVTNDSKPDTPNMVEPSHTFDSKDRPRGAFDAILDSRCFVGKVLDIYRSDPPCLPQLSTGELVRFLSRHINEIPLSWQPEDFQERVKHIGPTGEGYSITGLQEENDN